MSEEFKKYEKAAKALIKKAQNYAVTGGDETESEANRKLEESLHKARWRLDDQLRRLGLSDDAKAEALQRQVVETVRAAPKLAAEARSVTRQAQLKALDEKAKEHRRWRIENGLEDPPKRY